MTRQHHTLVTLACAIAIHAAASTAHGRITADQPSAIVTFPLLRADALRGEDTTIQISNADGSAPVDVACFLQQLLGQCSQAPQHACATSSDCGAGDCDGVERIITPFRLRLTPSQPLRWQLSSGSSLPLPENGDPIPAAPTNPFVGALRCVAVDANGAPVERNVLLGEATLFRHEPDPPRIDAAKYNAVGNAALSGVNNGDQQLIIGGPAAEYEGCPAFLTLNHLFDHALEPSAQTSMLFTDLTLAGCSGDLFGRGMPETTTAQFFVINEFEQRFSTSVVVATPQTRQLSLMDTSQSLRSIFSAAVTGTLAGQTRIRGANAGIMGIAVERRQDLADPTKASSAAFNLHSSGEQTAGDAVGIGPCGVGPRPGCRQAQRNSLDLSLGRSERGNSVVWIWRNGETTPVADFGNPASTSEYALCVYAGPAADVVAEINVPPSSARWRAVRRGLRYNDPAGTADGVRRMSLTRISAERALVVLRAKGTALPALELGAPLQMPVIVQLRHTDSSVCFESTFDAGAVVTNQPGTFGARTP